MKEKHEGNFKKAIGPFSGISIVAGMVIGSGIYYLGSYVLERTGMSLGWSLVAWLIGGLITIISGLCFAELGAFQVRGLAAGHQNDIIATDILGKMLRQCGAHHPAGAVALHGMAHLFGSGQPDTGIPQPVFGHVQNTVRVHIAFAPAVYPVELPVFI